MRIVRALLQFSIFHLIVLGASVLLGVAAGQSFVWFDPDRAWDLLIAGFLWVLIIAAGTGLARCVYQRIERGDWWRGLAVGCEMTFPATTLYLLAVMLASLGAADTAVLADGREVAVRPNILSFAPLFYGITLVMALFIGPLYTLTSPFGTKHTSSSQSSSQ